MAGPKRLTLFVEGDGDKAGVPVLIDRLLKGMNPRPWDALFLDKNDPFVAGELNQLVPCRKGQPPDFSDWHRFLETALRTGKNLGAILCVLDGDARLFDGQPFCAATTARRLAGESRAKGGGVLFSVAVVFAVQEYESWILAGFDSLTRRKPGTQPPTNVEQKRDAKGELKKCLKGGYKPTLHQAEVTGEVDLDMIRTAHPRSFLRLENALALLVAACRSGTHIVSPVLASQPEPNQ